MFDCVLSGSHESKLFCGGASAIGRSANALAVISEERNTIFVIINISLKNCNFIFRFFFLLSFFL